VAGVDSVQKLGEFDLNAVTPDYFATMGTRIIRGRGLERQDVENAPKAMVVSEAMARVLWPGKEALGQCVKINADTVPCTYVVGIAENIKSNSLSGDPEFYYYLSSDQFNPQRTGLLVRTRGDASSQVDAIRRQLQRTMPGASYITVTRFSDVIGGETQSWKLGATMFVAFGVLALVLAAIGLYSVIAYNVQQRTHELGVRVALGAQVRDVIGLVVKDGLRLTVIGVVIGGAVAFWAGKYVKDLLFNVSPKDPTVFAIVTIVLLVAAMAASLIPAARAARVDPNVALRTE
jgi:predicted permease